MSVAKLVIVIVAAAIVAATVAVVVTLAVNRPTYNEAAHRTDVEQTLGRPVTEWSEYVRVFRDICADSDRGFELFVAIALDDDAQQLEPIRVNVRHLCPEREELIRKVIDLSSRP